MTGDGTLLNKDTFNWALWEPKVGNDDHALEVMRTITALRQGPGRDFLVYGRMQPPAQIDDIATISWQHGDRSWQVPAVFHAAWQSPEGRTGVVLANWTEYRQHVQLHDDRLGTQVTVHTSASQLNSCTQVMPATLELPPHSCLLVI